MFYFFFSSPLCTSIPDCISFLHLSKNIAKYPLYACLFLSPGGVEIWTRHWEFPNNFSLSNLLLFYLTLEEFKEINNEKTYFSERQQQQGWAHSVVCIGPFEGDDHYLHYLLCSVASGQTTGREHSSTLQKKIGLKI